MALEYKRQALHIGFGLALIAWLYALPASWKEPFELSLFIVLIAGMIIVDLKLRGRATPFDVLFKLLERKNAPPGYGAFWYGLGVILASTLLALKAELASVLWVLSVGDGIATFIGKHYGKLELPYNRAKTLEGTLAMFVASLGCYVFIGEKALVLAAVATLVETLDLKLDDNFTIPVASALTLLFI